MANPTRSQLIVLLMMLVLTGAARGTSLDLVGRWRFELDPEDKGIAEHWQLRRLTDKIRLPGTTDLAAKGFPLDHSSMTYSVPFEYSTFPAVHPTDRADARGFLVREHYYLGRAWYQREFEIPGDWSAKTVQLELERVLWESRVWIDERFVGSCDSLVSAHRYDLGTLTPGTHTLTVAVDNRMIHNTGTIGRAYGPETQSRWNGVIGRIRLVAQEPVHISALRVFPAANRKQVTAEVLCRNTGEAPWSGQLQCKVLPLQEEHSLGKAHQNVSVPPGQSTLKIRVPLQETALSWDEFSPIRYRFQARLAGDAIQDPCESAFGFRQIDRDGRFIRVNGRRIFLRGTLDCCVYPMTGHPPMTLTEWLRVLGVIKSYGFNHVRFHSWCPPETAFAAADQLGLYLAPETSFWVDDWTTQTYSKPKGLGRDPEVLAFVRREIRRIGDAYGNHPSFALFCIGNEFGMNSTDWDAADRLVQEAKDHDPRRLYLATTARRQLTADDFRVTHHTGASTRGVGPAHTDWDFSQAAAITDLPLIAHETGQRPVFPNYNDLLKRFTGPLKPYNYLRLRHALDAAGMLDQAPDFQRASARFQFVQYKSEHEGMLRTPDYAGYQLLMLNDFTGQSEALVGILNPFWNEKGVVQRQEILRWNAPTVPLARFPRYVWSTDDIFHATIEVAHYGPANLKQTSTAWQLATPGNILARGSFPSTPIPTGRLTTIGRISVPLDNLQNATALSLSVTVADTRNRWKIWAYPPSEIAEPGDDILVTHELSPPASQTLLAGGRVVLLAHGLQNPWTAQTGFLSVYWSAGWGKDHFASLGITCDPNHPALAQFPNDGHSDWQWRELTEDATTFLLDQAPEGYRPIIQPVTDFHFNRRLGHLFEAQVGRGRLLVCGYDLEDNLDRRHAARQFRHSLLRYASSARFHPRQKLPIEYVSTLLAAPAE